MVKKIRCATKRQVFVYKTQVVRAKPQRLDKILASGVSKRVGGELAPAVYSVRKNAIQAPPIFLGDVAGQCDQVAPVGYPY
jgi:hypothetical protein